MKGSPATVLIRGESGSGKEVVAWAIHARGPRQHRPFLSVNGSVLPENLVERELFGHEVGAFTGAKKGKMGLFELAEGGTLFLDEIGDMPKGTQAKLLEFLETHRFRRIGGVRDLEVDVQVLTATNRILEDAVEAGDFRDDLFYRLNVIPVHVPPLRDRPEDIPHLAAHFVRTTCDEMSIAHRTLSRESVAALESYRWPGNARELRNAIERILLLHDDETIGIEHLPAEIVDSEVADDLRFPLPAGGVALAAVERTLIVQALDRAEGNKSRAAGLLGISRHALRYRFDKYGLGSDAD